MAVDVRTSGARQRMRIFAGSSDTVTVRWFKCRAGAKTLPFPCAINAASIWESREWDANRPIGEAVMWGTPTKDDLAYRAPGLSYCGEPAWFLTGIPAANVHDQPCDCMAQPGQCILCEDSADLEQEDGTGCIEQEQST